MKTLKLKKIFAVAVVAIGLAAGVANVAFSAVPTDPDTEGVQLWADGPYWATCNVGASKPEDYGYYFWWGDTVGYRYLNSKWEAVASSTVIEFSSGKAPANSTCNKTVDQLKAAGYLDAQNNLVSSCDAATAYLGAPWRMPTKADFDNLKGKCTTVWANNWNGTGVNGCLVTGKTTGYTDKSIFLPAAAYGYGAVPGATGSYGDYWSSTPYSDSSSGWRFDFLSTTFNVGSNYRYVGRPVRPVRGFAK